MKSIVTALVDPSGAADYGPDAYVEIWSQLPVGAGGTIATDKPLRVPVTLTGLSTPPIRAGNYLIRMKLASSRTALGPYPFTMPDGDGTTELWPLIAAGVNIPGDTPIQKIQEALAAYLIANPAGGGGEANVELAYAETSSKVPMNTSDAYADAAGLAITFATTGRPAMVTANLGTLYGSDNATWGLAVVRVSDGAVMAEGVANSSPTVGYPPPPVLQFRVPANTASNTYRVQTKRWDGGATGEINSQERRAFIQAVAV